MSTPKMVAETYGVFLEFRGVDPLLHVAEIRTIASRIPNSLIISDEERQFVVDLFEKAHSTKFSNSILFWVKKSVPEEKVARLGELASEFARLSSSKQFELSVGSALCTRTIGGTQETTTQTIQRIENEADPLWSVTSTVTSAVAPEDKRIEVVFGAATLHAEDTGEFDHEVGDLQDVLRAAWALMTNEQRQALLTGTEAKSVLEAGAKDPEQFERAPAAPGPSTDELLRACFGGADAADQAGETSQTADQTTAPPVNNAIPAGNVAAFAQLGLAMYSMTTSIHSPNIDFEEQLRCVPGIWQHCAEERDSFAAKAKPAQAKEHEFRTVLRRWDLGSGVEQPMAHEPNYSAHFQVNGEHLWLDVSPAGSTDEEPLSPSLQLAIEINNGLPCVHVHTNSGDALRMSLFGDTDGQVCVRPGEGMVIRNNYLPAIEEVDRFFGKAGTGDAERPAAEPAPQP